MTVTTSVNLGIIVLCKPEQQDSYRKRVGAPRRGRRSISLKPCAPLFLGTNNESHTGLIQERSHPNWISKKLGEELQRCFLRGRSAKSVAVGAEVIGEAPTFCVLHAV